MDCLICLRFLIVAHVTSLVHLMAIHTLCNWHLNSPLPLSLSLFVSHSFTLYFVLLLTLFSPLFCVCKLDLDFRIQDLLSLFFCFSFLPPLSGIQNSLLEYEYTEREGITGISFSLSRPLLERSIRGEGGKEFKNLEFAALDCFGV